MALKLEVGSKLVAATHNPGKVPEIAALLDGRFEIVTAGQLGLPEPDETESTFVGNALLKARHAADLSGLPALADDSGLSVKALDGAPGIFSARWAGPTKDFAQPVVTSKRSRSAPPQTSGDTSVLVGSEASMRSPTPSLDTFSRGGKPEKKPAECSSWP